MSEPRFEIQRIYTKDMSFESPQAPAVFKQEWKPEINIDIKTQSTIVEENLHEVVLTVTATNKMVDKVIFLVEIQQAGLFTATGFDRDQLGHMLGSFCPTILFPYAREVMSDLVVRGGFPPLYLMPVNFDALYAQHIKQQSGDASETQH